MNKFHYLAAVATSAMMLASCSTDEVLSSAENPQTISFDAMANKPSRTGVTSTNIERFRVYGCTMDNNSTANHTTIFNNITVSRTDGSSNWTYDNLQYWAPNKDYYFVAISTNVMEPKWTFSTPDEHDGSLTVGNFKGYGTVTMDVAEVDADNDLVYAYASRATDAEISNSTKIPFSFNHMLSRIGLKFTNSISSTGYTIHISDIRISGIAASGSVELGVEPANLSWTPSGTANVTATVPDNNSLVQNSSIVSDYKYIIPGEQTLFIEFTAQVSLNGNVYSTRTLTGTIAAKEYKPGCSYMLNAAISADNIVPGGAKPIEFTVSVATWTNGDDGNINFPEPANP